jgi:LCP family protein required for cell wall assembly
MGAWPADDAPKSAPMNRTQALLLGIAALILAGIVAVLILSAQQPVAEATPTPSPSPSGTPSPSATPSLNAELLNQRLTVLLVGIDLNEARAGMTANTDALLTVSINADQSQVSLVSLPRDTVDVPLPDGTTLDSKINGLFAVQGIDAVVGAMETLYGVPIDGYVTLDMDDFSALVDAAGGVTVNPSAPLADPGVAIDLAPGEQELDAPTTLGYVRTRVDQDYGRMARQQEVIVDLVRRLVDPETEVDLQALIDGLDSFETDLDLADLPTYVEIARRAAEADVQGLVIGPPEQIVFEGDRGDGRGYVLIPDVDAIREAVQELIPPEE